jgi:ketosteroid isomerase-like protein
VHAVLALVLAVAVTGCAPQAADQSAELASAAEGWQAAFNAKDVDALAALYTEDCVFMPPNAEFETGHAFVKEHVGGMIEAGLDVQLATMAASAAGGVGYRAGTFTLQAPAGALVDRGKFIEGWQKIDGQWKIVHDTYNSDLPPFATATTVVATHDVKDGDHWLAAWRGENSRHGLFAEHGVANVRVFQNPEQPNQTGLVIDVTDMAALQAMLASEVGATAKAEDGVIDTTLKFYAEVN